MTQTLMSEEEKPNSETPEVSDDDLDDTPLEPRQEDACSIDDDCESCQ